MKASGTNLCNSAYFFPTPFFIFYSETILYRLSIQYDKYFMGL